jgi:hypothetical protein
MDISLRNPLRNNPTRLKHRREPRPSKEPVGLLSRGPFCDFGSVLKLVAYLIQSARPSAHFASTATTFADQPVESSLGGMFAVYCASRCRSDGVTAARR